MSANRFVSFKEDLFETPKVGEHSIRLVRSTREMMGNTVTQYYVLDEHNRALGVDFRQSRAVNKLRDAYHAQCESLDLEVDRNTDFQLETMMKEAANQERTARHEQSQRADFTQTAQEFAEAAQMLLEG